MSESVKAADVLVGMRIYAVDALRKKAIYGEVATVADPVASTAGETVSIGFGPGRPAINVPTDSVFFKIDNK